MRTLSLLLGQTGSHGGRGVGVGVIYTEVWNTKGRCKTVGWGFTKRVPLSEGSTDVLPVKKMTIMCTATDVFCWRQYTDFNMMPWTLRRVWDWDWYITNPAQWKSKADRSNDCKTHQYKTTMTITMILILHTHSNKHSSWNSTSRVYWCGR